MSTLTFKSDKLRWGARIAQVPVCAAIDKDGFRSRHPLGVGKADNEPSVVIVSNR